MKLERRLTVTAFRYLTEVGASPQIIRQHVGQDFSDLDVQLISGWIIDAFVEGHAHLLLNQMRDAVTEDDCST